MVANATLAEEFAHGKTKGKGHNLFIEGNTIYSYGHHFPIATIIGDKKALFNEDKYSVSTGKHKSYVRRALLAEGFTLEESNTSKLQETGTWMAGHQRKKLKDMS